MTAGRDPQPGENGGKLILVRHAQTVLDPEVDAEFWRLDESARADCRELANRLAPLRPQRVITSEQRKAIGTGRYMAEALNLTHTTADGLEEHDRTAAPFIEDPEEWNATLERVFSLPDEVVLGTETANVALERFETAIRREVARRPGERLLLVSHATVMTLFLARHNRLEPFEFWRSIRMPEAFVLGLPDYRLLERLRARAGSD